MLGLPPLLCMPWSPVHLPSAIATFGFPQASSTVDSLASAFAEQSTAHSVRHIQITPAQTQVKVTSSSLHSVECQGFLSIVTACLNLAPHLGFKVVACSEDVKS